MSAGERSQARKQRLGLSSGGCFYAAHAEEVQDTWITGVARGGTWLRFPVVQRFHQISACQLGCAACYVDLDVEKTSTTSSLHVDLPGARVDLGMANISFEAPQ